MTRFSFLPNTYTYGCEKEKEFWEKIEEQNGFTKNSIQGKIVYRSMNGKSQRMTIIAEVYIKTHEAMVEEGKVKIRWNICKVQDYVGILKGFKCYYHFAKDCKKDVICGKCNKSGNAGNHATKECKNEIRKCVNIQNHNYNPPFPFLFISYFERGNRRRNPYSSSSTTTMTTFTPCDLNDLT